MDRHRDCRQAIALKGRQVISVLILLSSVLTACGSSPTPRPSASPPAAATGGTSELENSNWALVSIGGGNLLPGTMITASFANGRVFGHGGCNEYFARFAAGGGTLQIGEVGATKKACQAPKGVMEQESAYLEALRRATGYRIAGDRLAFSMGGMQDVLVFTRQ